jgi:RNA polymerase sigma factor (sigma-70 family)
VEGNAVHLRPAGPLARPQEGAAAAGCPEAAGHAVTALYRSHALGMTRLAYLMLGDRQAAEDVVQEAFCGLFRAWDRLPERTNMAAYLRVSVMNGCRSVLRRARRAPRLPAMPPAPSAEASVLVGEERRAAVAALRRLPPR